MKNKNKHNHRKDNKALIAYEVNCNKSDEPPSCVCRLQINLVEDLLRTAEELKSDIVELRQALHGSEPAKEDHLDLLTLRQVATRLGKSQRTVKRWVDKGLLAACRVPNERNFTWLFRESEVVRFLDEDCF